MFNVMSVDKTTFADGIEAMLDGTLRLGRRDPSASAGLCEQLVDAAIGAGEIAPADREIVIDTLVTIAFGLSSLSPTRQAEAVQGFKRMFRGERLVGTDE